MDKRRVSKLLSKVLRHDPGLANVTLEEGGWVDVSTLLLGLQGLGVSLTREELRTIVDTNDKKRFTISDDGGRIRAAQGHSAQVEMAYEPAQPPGVLYHGTAQRTLDLILRDGLQPQRRQFVHLSTDFVTAQKVGQRHGSPVVLTVDTNAMADKGHKFFCAENGVWLTPTVPPEFLDVCTDGQAHNEGAN